MQGNPDRLGKHLVGLACERDIGKETGVVESIHFGNVG